MKQPITHHLNRLRRSRRRPSGTVIIAALVCLLIVMTVLGNMLQGTLLVRRQLHAQRDLRQTQLLLQAGAARAVYRLTREPGYLGETVQMPAEEIIGTGAGQIIIEATPPSDGASIQVLVRAEYPLGSERSIRRSRTFRYPIPTIPNKE